MIDQQVNGIPGLNIDDLQLTGFKVHKLGPSNELPERNGRRDFYKMGILNGEISVDYAGALHEVRGTVLFFVNPKEPRSIVRRINRISGYACVFTDAFLTTRDLQDSPLFRLGDNPMIPLDSDQAAFMTGIFFKMAAVYEGEYPYKSSLIRNCISLIIHEALRIQPPRESTSFKNGVSRISHMFMELLEKQFPIENRQEALAMRTAQDYATALSVHVNYLNRAVKMTTGKPTSAHISNRITAEAKAMLQHSEWSVAEIAYALGFEYPAYFNNYFKRVTGTSPNKFRKV
ncbi:helix-turn-helix domain-containing protein [Pedobacter sp. GSP4]|uniref:helix-turn-helix domain-containing protein n=1 Tax=Pedobacter sp. GSP4 TaxID=3453716 RepID=UPI003EED8D1A